MKLELLAAYLVISNGLGLWSEHAIEDLPGDINSEFKNWMETYDKSYNIVEEARRMVIFEANWRMINTHNLEYEQGLHTWTMAMNQFGDMTVDEFSNYTRCRQGTQLAIGEVEEVDNSDVMAPESLDWTDVNGKSYVTPVKNQGQCGSCWAFSATGAMESATAISKGETGSQITTLSEQQLVDCTYHRSGCSGGLPTDAFSYASKDGGLCSEQEYRYTGRGGTCRASTCGTKYDPVRSYKSVAKSESGLRNAIAIEPVSVGVDASGSGWQFYHGGVYSGACGTNIDHAVLAVGYGTEKSAGDYWKIKNSWGASWGMQGYILLCRNCGKPGGQCGVLLDNAYPVV